MIVDLFAGGGGASTGIEQAIGRPVDIAINHDPEAISMHAANHPGTKHYTGDIFEVDPLEATQGRPVGLLWASPSCTHFSRARGGVPVSKQLRSHGWAVVRWIAATRPREVYCENVNEWQEWGPVLANKGIPCPRRKGKTFRQFVGHIERLGYRVEIRELRGCDYGAGTIRKRLFLIAKRDRMPIHWPQPTHNEHGTNGLQPWRTAAECIDWSLHCPSIFERKKPLADATLRRIARGIVRYVLEAQEPFIVTNTSGHPGAPVSDPLRTVTTAGNQMLCVPTLIQAGYGEREGQKPRVLDIEKPLGTIVAGGGKHALVAAFLAKHYTGVVGADLRDPMPTVTSVDHNALVTAFLTEHANGSNQRVFSAEEPLRTQCAQVKGGHFALVAALLIKYYGNEREGVSLTEPLHTIPTKDRFGLVTVSIQGQPYYISDIGMRMLAPHELYAAQGFPPDYQIDRGADGRAITKTAQVRMVGNSVCPPVARAIVEANYAQAMAAQEQAA